MVAAAAHSGMTRKGTGIPYLSHPVEAASIIAEMTDDQELIAAAVLHDVVEDTEVTAQELEEMFGSRVAHYVACETERISVGICRQRRPGWFVSSRCLHS